MLELEDIIAVWARRELKKKNVGALYNIWQAKQVVILDYFWRFDRRSEVF